MKSTLAIIAISAILLIGMVFIPGMNMKAYSQSQQDKQTASPVRNLVYIAVEKNLTLPDGTTFHALTWNGTIPGPTVRLTQGDTVHVTIVNPTGNKLIHSFDTHASIISAVPNFGPINPGSTKNFTFIATQPGVFKVHCEGNGVLTMDQHVFSGMVMTMIVDPAHGYTGYTTVNSATGANQTVSPKAKEVIFEFSEYYFNKKGDYDSQAMFNHNATSTWINGIPFGYDPIITKTKNATTLFFNVGDHVRFFLLNHGDIPVNFHIVGGSLDRVTDGNVVSGIGKQTYTVGGSNDAIVDVTFDKPGVFAPVNHDYSSLFKGQAGLIVVNDPAHSISKKLKITDESNPSNAIPPLGKDSIPVKTKPYMLGTPLKISSLSSLLTKTGQKQ
ncbi:MAG TPA: multicopper oxidase domain-containing protein [Candidatus Nitrosocosmicus sp.]